MAIKEANGSIIINLTPSAVTLLPTSRDDGKGIEVFEFPDSALATAHVLQKRDLGRSTSSDGQIVQKGKVSIVRETVTVAGKRRTMVQTANLAANADFTSAQVGDDIRALGQFLLDNADDLALGRFGS